MSGSAFVVVPVNEGEKGEQLYDHDKIASAIQGSLNQRSTGQGNFAQRAEAAGPLGNIFDNSDSIYKYISWENPTQTLGAFIAAMVVLFGAHYIPLTQFVLKYVATALGGVSLIEFAGRSFTSNTLSARLRPAGGYKKIPESTLNATLRDLHDLLQATVVQFQKVVYGEDLRKTFTAFLAATGLFWLIKFVPPFWLTVLAVTSLFLAPLVNSPQGRETARAAKQRGAEVAQAAAHNGKQLARDGQAKAGQLSSSVKQSSNQVRFNVNEAASSAHGNASDAAGQLSSKSQGLTAQAKDSANSSLSGISNSANNSAQQTGNSVNDGTDRASQASGRAAGLANTTGLEDSPDSGHGFDTDSSSSEYPRNNASSTTGGVAGDGKVFGNVDEAASRYVAADSQAGTHGIMNRSRGELALNETAGVTNL